MHSGFMRNLLESFFPRLNTSKSVRHSGSILVEKRPLVQFSAFHFELRTTTGTFQKKRRKLCIVK